jgi:hypothetical protein
MSTTKGINAKRNGNPSKSHLWMILNQAFFADVRSVVKAEQVGNHPAFAQSHVGRVSFADESGAKNRAAR